MKKNLFLILYFSLLYSQNYYLKSDVLSAGATNASSNSFRLKGTLHQVAESAPWLNSQNYKAIIGFWHPFFMTELKEKLREPSEFSLKNFLYPPVQDIKSKSIVFKYSISKKGKVSITIYNSLGQKVITLLEKEQIPGIYEIKLNIKENKLGRGVYFCELKIKNFETKRKFIVF
ncbi:MAG: T9SS type A sorting domain-containing protein [candidate division WOR-3 bacterium]